MEISKETSSNGIRRLYDSAEYALSRRARCNSGPPADAEIELAVRRLKPNWTRVVPRSRTGVAIHILQSLAHGRSHAVVLGIKRSPCRLGGLPLPNADCRYQR